MKKLTIIISVLILMNGVYSCNGQENIRSTTQTLHSSNVNVYYFHFTRRCSTFINVEENSRKAVESLFPENIKSGEYSFTSLNLDEDTSIEIANKLGVGGQSLLIVRGDKKIDITSAAWLAANDPEKMKVEIKSGIDKILF